MSAPFPPPPPPFPGTEPAPPAESADERQDRLLWRRRTRITAWMLVIWFAVTFGVTFFARELDVVVLGWPLSFWVAAQGALLVYMVLVVVFARDMGRIDDERDAPAPGRDG